MLDYLYKLKNKEFIFACLRILKEKSLLTDVNLKALTGKSTCYNHFDFSYPILTEVSPIGTIPREMFVDASDNRRYYPDTFVVNGRRFIVCNDWYYGKTRDNRTRFVNWIEGMIK